MTSATKREVRDYVIKRCVGALKAKNLGRIPEAGVQHHLDEVYAMCTDPSTAHEVMLEAAR